VLCAASKRLIVILGPRTVTRYPEHLCSETLLRADYRANTARIGAAAIPSGYRSTWYVLGSVIACPHLTQGGPEMRY
jgi:hypothetical protein